MMLKKTVTLLAVMLGVIVLGYYANTFPKSFSSVAKLDYKVKNIILINTVHQAPLVKISNQEDIEKILKHLMTYKYRKTYFFLSSPPGGHQFALKLEGNNPNENVRINFSGTILTINGQDYSVNQDVTWEIASYLITKSFDRQADMTHFNTIRETVDKISRKYDEPHPVIENIKPDIKYEKSLPRPMFRIYLKGNFKNGNKQALNLSFSMLENGTKVWDIRATNADNKTFWEDSANKFN